MSISSYTTVTMLDSRPARITISVPKSTDITNRIITFKDLYGSASNSTIVLVTRSGDTFEDGTFSTIMSNAYQTVNLYAGQPGKWLNIGSSAASGGGGDITTVSNLLNAVSTNVTTVSTNLNTVSNLLNAVSTNVTTVSTNLNTVSNLLNAVSTNVTSVSTNLNTVSNTVAAGRFTGISTNNISTNLVAAAYISSPQGYISSLIVDSLSFSLSNSFIVMGDIITTSVSTIQTFTSSLTTNNLKVGTVSSLNYIAFSGLQQGYNQSVIAEQSTGTGLQELLVFRGSSASDRIRMQTTGPIIFEPGVSARVFPSAGSNVTPAMIINTSSNVGIGIAAPTVSLDVAGGGRFTTVSTNTISTMTLTVSNINGPGDLPITAAAGCNANITGLYINLIANNVQFSSNFAMNSGTTAATYNLTAQNFTRTAAVSTNTISTNIVNGGYLVGKLPANTSATSVSPLAVVNGGANTTYVSQIEFQYSAGGFKHFMGSRHNDSFYNNSCNAIDFWLFSGSGSNASTAPGTCNVNTMSVTAAGVGICNATPSVALDVTGTGRFQMLSTQQIYVSSISSGSVYGKFIGDGSLLTGLPSGGSGGLPISTNNTTLTNPASIIIKTPNTSYFYADYTNLTNYITISNYGAINGDYINVVNTGNSGTPATFQILDGSTSLSTIIRYIYPGHAGVVAYSGSQWWPL